ncbi:hypothetical protein ES703_45764 [subsurface metagenome]
MNKFKKWLIPVAIVCLLLASLIGCSSAPASLGETFDPSGNPFAHRFSDVKDIRTATFVVAASDSEHKYEADYFCNGTNDHVQIQAAIDALPASGGRVMLSEGTFSVSTNIALKSYTTLSGNGWGSIIKLADEATFTRSGIIRATGGTSYITVRDLAIDGNKANQTDDTGKQGFYCGKDDAPSLYVQLLNLYVHDCPRHGLGAHEITRYLTIEDCTLTNNGKAGSVYSGISNEYCEYSIIKNNISIGSAAHGITSVNTCSYNSYLGNICIGNGETGINADDATALLMEGNICKENGQYGMYLGASPGCSVIGNTVALNQQDGIRLYSSPHCIVSNNKLTNNSQESDSTYREIRLREDSTYCLVAGNRIECTAVNKSGYGIREETTADYNLIINNIINGPVTANIYVLGANTIYSIQHSDLFMDVLAASANYIVNTQNLVNGAVALTGSQPKYPRGLVFAITEGAPGDVSDYTMTVVGTNGKGETITEVFTFAVDGLTWSSNNAFDHVTSITLADVADLGAATLDVGIDDRLGLQNLIYETSDVWKITKNLAKQTVAVAQVDTDYDTYDMSVIILALNDDFVIYYRSNLNTIS